MSLLRRTLQERQAELTKARAQVAELLAKEKELVAESVRSAPTRRPFTIGSAAQRNRARREKLADSIPSLEIEIAELVTVVEEEEAAHYAVELDEARVQAGRLRKQEIAAWEKAAEALVQMYDCFCAILDPAEELDRLVAAVRHSEAGTRCTDTEAVRAFVDASRPVIDPMPFTFEAFLVRLAQVAGGDVETNDWRADQDGRLAEIIPRLPLRVPQLRADRVNRA